MDAHSHLDVNLRRAPRGEDVPTPKRPRRREIRELPPPRREGGWPLISTLRLRCSTREYSCRALPVELLSDLLWAAFGINRDDGERTAPYWRHVRIIDVYLAMQDGVWLYDPEAHTLTRHMAKDIRGRTGFQEFAETAPLNFIFVARGDRMTELSPERRRLFASVDTGFMGQNVYLFCASEGLGTVFRDAVDFDALGQILELPKTQFVTFAQTVGFPRGSAPGR
jgi:hypothetical protein